MTDLPPGKHLMPETPAEHVGSVVVEEFRFGDQVLKLARPVAPEKLLDLDTVAAAYERDEYMPYWATLWPVSRYLAEAVLARYWASGGRAIELGCGLGLPGVAAIARGLSVTFTDYDATALRFAAENAKLNGFPHAPCYQLDWREPAPQLGRFNVVLASDLIYEERNVEPLVASFGRLLAKGGVALVADQNRAWAVKFRQELRRSGFDWVEQAGSGEVPGTVYTVTQRS
jgi:predicted nicotinamide N-methyase